MFSCVAAPEMIQYYLELGISSENLIETYWRMFRPMTVPVGAGAVVSNELPIRIIVEKDEEKMR